MKSFLLTGSTIQKNLVRARQ